MHPVITALIRNLPGSSTLLTRPQEKETEPMTINPHAARDAVAAAKARKLDEKQSRDRNPSGFSPNAKAARKRLGMSPEDPDLSRTSDSLKQKAARAAKVAK